MSEEQNIPEVKSETINTKPENVNEQFPEDSEAPQPSTLNLQLRTWKYTNISTT